MFNSLPILFINCQSFPFIAWILSGLKVYETRNRNTLKSFIGKQVYLCETGKKQKIVRCKAIIKDVIIIKDLDTWNQYRKHLSIAIGNNYDWKDGTKVKYLYKLKNVVFVSEFEPKEGKRNGYTWMVNKGKAK